MISHGREVISLSGSGWTLDGEPVSVPHTWNAIDGADGGENPPGTFTSCRAVSYVRKAATYSRSLPDPTPGKRQFVKCEAVSIKAIVRVNGREVGRHAGAFTAFCFEVTDFLKPSGNVLEIVADNTLDENVHPIVGDFTMYGGVYRDVFFIETDPVCIDCVTDGADGVAIDANPETGEVVVHVSVLGGTNETQRFRFDRPQLWSPENPATYSVRVTVRQKGCEDSIEVPFGFRKIEFDSDGFRLNGIRDKAELDARIYNFPTSALKENGRKIRYVDFFRRHADDLLASSIARIVPRIDMAAISTFIDELPFLSELQHTFYKTYIAARYEALFM